MSLDKSYAGINSRKNEIMKNAMQIDYDQFEKEGIGFDYEGMMKKVGYSIEEMRKIQLEHGVDRKSVV